MGNREVEEEGKGVWREGKEEGGKEEGGKEEGGKEGGIREERREE